MSLLKAIAEYRAAVVAAEKALSRWNSALRERDDACQVLADARSAETDARERMREAMAADARVSA